MTSLLTGDSLLTGLFAVSVCQSLFIAPCSHAFHYKCIRPLLELHHPGFSCPLCRTFADLDADVEVDEAELKAIEDALDEAEEPASDSGAVNAELPAAKREGESADDAIVVDSDSGGSPARPAVAPAEVKVVSTHAVLPTLQIRSAPLAAASSAHDVHDNAAIDEDRQVEDELEADFDEDDDERMASGSADEFGQRQGDDNMDGTFAIGHHGNEATASGSGPSGSRPIPLSINAGRAAAEAQAEREANEFADA